MDEEKQMKMIDRIATTGGGA